MIKFILLVVFGLLTSSLNAGTVELFLLKEHNGQIENLERVEERGHQLIYRYLDAEVAIENQLTSEVSEPLERLFQSVVKGLSSDELEALGEAGVTTEVMKLVASDAEFKQQADIMQSVSNDPDMKAALIQADKDKQLAKERGVIMDDLPAIIFNNEKFANVADAESVLDSVVSE